MNDRLSDIEWRWKRLDDLTTAEVYDMLAARSAVFVVEQNCVYGDIDRLDLDAWHLLAYGPASENQARPALAGYLRVLLSGFPNEGEKDVRFAPRADDREVPRPEARQRDALTRARTHFRAVAGRSRQPACAGVSAKVLWRVRFRAVVGHSRRGRHPLVGCAAPAPS